MKAFFLTFLALSTSAAFAQTLTKPALKALLTERQAILEAVNVGMSKKITTTSSFLSENGNKCDYGLTSVQTVVRIEGDKMIVYSDESFSPVASVGCQEAQAVASNEKILSYEPKPSLAEDLAELEAGEVLSISKAGNIITMQVNGELEQEEGTPIKELVTVRYDLTKSSFKNLISTQTKNYTAVTTDMADVDVNTLDLKKVLFCADEDDCVEGDFSDILFK